MGEGILIGSEGMELLPTAAPEVFLAVDTQDLPECVEKSSPANLITQASKHDSLSVRGEWMADAQGTLRWIRGTERCVTPIFYDDQVAQCLERVRPIAIMGDSHLRHASKWLLAYLGYTPEQLT